jgi:hypothetical protein
LGDTNNDSKLHLIGVEEVQLIACSDPFRIHSNRVDAIFNFLSKLLWLSVTIARSKDVPGNREEFIVNPSTVESERAHH